MAKRQVKSVSLPADLYEYAQSMDNFSGFVRDRLEEHRAANQMTAEERIRREIEELEEERRKLEQKERRVDGEIAELEEKLDYHRGRRNETYEEVLDFFHSLVQVEEEYHEKRIKNGNPSDIPGDDLLAIYEACDLHSVDGTGRPVGEYVELDLDEAGLPLDALGFGNEATDDETERAEALFEGLTPREEKEVIAALDDYFEGE